MRGAPAPASVRKVLPPPRKVASPIAMQQRLPTEAPAPALPLPPSHLLPRNSRGLWTQKEATHGRNITVRNVHLYYLPFLTTSLTFFLLLYILLIFPLFPTKSELRAY